MQQKKCQFFCYIGRGKRAHAKSGKARFVFWDTTGADYDHARLDTMLSDIWRKVGYALTTFSRIEFVRKTRKVISELAPHCIKADTDVLDVSFPEGTILRFRIMPYEYLAEHRPMFFEPRPKCSA
ncbi:MAG: hypothetical protein WDA68_02825 [Phycisphaerae bacterium]